MNKFIDTEKYVFKFGKYKGQTIDDVCEKDPQYLLWCHDNLNNFTLSREDISLIEELAEEQYSYNSYNKYSNNYDNNYYHKEYDESDYEIDGYDLNVDWYKD